MIKLKWKNTISLVLAVTVMLSGITFGADKVNAASTDSSFKYVITPKSPEWKNFEAVELKDKLNIPIAEAENMDTDTLLNVVLDYPFLGDIYAFNDPSKAIDLLAEQFNGLKVLLKREDLKDKLVRSYKDSSDKIMNLKVNEKINSEERYKHKYRESLFAYPTVFNKLSKTEKNTIISNSEKVATKIDTRPIAVEQRTTFGKTATFVSILSIDTRPKTAEQATTLGVVSILAAGDVIRYGSVLTPRSSTVSVMELEDLTAADKISYDNYMASVYPNAIKLRTATYKYNCHSYAWYSTSTSNVWWMNDASKYMTDGSYTKYTTAASGQKIYYPNPGNEHSGIISSVNGSTITVTSKWGAYGLYSHSAGNCPYFSMYLNTYWR